MKIKIALFILSLTFSGCVWAKEVNACDVNLGSHPSVTAVQQTSPKTPWWLSRHQEIIERNKKGNVDLIFIGDSITHRWGKYKNSVSGEKIWGKYYAKRNAVNMGFGGDRTSHVLWRLQNGEVNGITPKAAVLLIGTNNLNSKSFTPEQVAEGIKAIICELRTRLPNTKILVIGILPKGSDEQRKDPNANAVYNPRWERGDKVNEIISKLADNKMIYYLNINKALLNENGVLTREIMPDLSHLSEKGYQIWAESMEPTLAVLMGEVKMERKDK